MSNFIGIPTLTIRDKNTGNVIKEITVKNTQTFHVDLNMSPEFLGTGLFLDRYKNDGVIQEPTDRPHIIVAPFLKTKSKRSGGLFANQSYNINDGFTVNNQKYYTMADLNPGENGYTTEIDNLGRLNLVFKGKLQAPTQTRDIGTIFVGNFSNPSAISKSNPFTFFTPLDELIVQDSTMIIDITYRVILDEDKNDPIKTGIVGSIFNHGTKINIGTRKDFDFDIPSDPSSADTREATTSIKYKNHLKDKYTGYIIPKNVKIKNVSNSPDNIFTRPIQSSVVQNLIYDSLNTCGNFTATSSYVNAAKDYWGFGNESSTMLTSVSGNQTPVVFEKKLQSGKTPKPFLDSGSFKTGTGQISVKRLEDNKYIPERWSLRVAKGGIPGVAEFELKKTYVSSYIGNNNIQLGASVPHLSTNASGHLIIPQFKCKNAEWYSYAGTYFALWGFNVAIVSQKGLILTGVTENNYHLFDKDNLPGATNDVWITGIGWDIAKKEIYLACKNNGLWKIKGDIYDTTAPVVTKIPSIDNVYAINTNGKGGVTIVDNTGMRFTKDGCQTWTTISKAELINENGFKDENYLKYLSSICTDYDSPDFKTFVLFDVNGRISTNYAKGLWISTSNKTGKQVQIYCDSYSDSYGSTYGVNLCSYCKEGYYVTDDLKTQLVPYFRYQSNKYSILGINHLYNIMPQKISMSANNRFFLGYTKSVKIFFGAVAEITFGSTSISNYSSSDSMLCDMSGNNLADEVICAYRGTNILNLSNISNGLMSGTIAEINKSVGDKTKSLVLSKKYVPMRDDNYSYIPVTAVTNGLYDLVVAFNRNACYQYTAEEYAEYFKPNRETPLKIMTTTYVLGQDEYGDFNSVNNIKIIKNSDNTFSEKVGLFETGDKFILSGTTVIDGMEITVGTSGTFIENDVYEFYKFDGYLNDNVSTAIIQSEFSSSKLSDTISHEGTISTEGPIQELRYPFISNGNARITRDGFIKSDGMPNGICSDSFNCATFGDFKLKIDPEKVKGLWCIAINIAQSDRGPTYGYGQGLRVYVGNVKGNKFWFIKTEAGPIQPINVSAATIKSNTLSGKTNVRIEYDSETRIISFKADDKVFYKTSPFSDKTIAMNTIHTAGFFYSMDVNGNLTSRLDPWSDLTANNFTLVTEQSEFKIPEFISANGKVLCTLLGNKEKKTGYFNPKYVGLPKLPNMFTVLINGAPAKKVYTNTENILDIRTEAEGFIHPPFLPQGEQSQTAIIETSLKTGEVYIEPTTAMVFFSQEDKGKPYKIEYKHYIDTHWGVDEVTNE